MVAEVVGILYTKNVRIRLSQHVLLRIRIRKIDKRILREIILNPEEIYFDIESKYWIAVKEEEYAGKKRPMVTVFEKKISEVDIITVYPSNRNEIESRVRKGRWTYEKENN